MSPKKTRSPFELSKLIIKATHYVGVITPAGAGSYGEILEGVRRGNASAADDNQVVVIVPYYTHDLDKTSIKIAVQRALSDKMNVIITVGSTIGRRAKEVLEKESPKTPLICAAVGEPVKTDLIPKYNDPENNLAVVGLEKGSGTEPLYFLHQALPKARKVLMPVPNGGEIWRSEYVDPLKQTAQELGLELEIFEGKNLHDLYAGAARRISKSDVLFVPEGNLILDRHRALGGLCDEKKKPFFACLDWAVRNSASLGYAMSLMPLGEQAIDYARRIIFDGIAAYKLPFDPFPDTRRPMLNTTIAAEQGLDHDELIKNVGLLDNILLCEDRLT